jgi:hypothetical protein
MLDFLVVNVILECSRIDHLLGVVVRHEADLSQARVMMCVVRVYLLGTWVSVYAICLLVFDALTKFVA